MNYYKSLDKKRKKEIKKEFLASDKSIVYRKSNKIYVISIIGIIFSILAGIFDYTNKYGEVLINYILDGFLFVFSIVFFVKMKSMKNKEINNYALSIKNN